MAINGPFIKSRVCTRSETHYNITRHTYYCICVHILFGSFLDQLVHHSQISILLKMMVSAMLLLLLLVMLTLVFSSSSSHLLDYPMLFYGDYLPRPYNQDLDYDDVRSLHHIYIALVIFNSIQILHFSVLN